MEPILFQIGKKIIFSKILKYPTNSFYMNLVEIFGIDQNVIPIYKNKDINLFG